MKPVVALCRLGRRRYSEALSIQQTLFDNLKQKVSGKSINYQPEPCNYSIHQNINQHQATHHASKDKMATRNEIPFNNLLISKRVKNSLLLVEHEPVYTIGIRSKGYDDSYFEKLKMELVERRLEADFIKTNRGGLITFHGPGQLVAYPIIYLGDFSKIQNKSVKAYVSLLERTVIDTLSMIGIKDSHTVKEYPGVWLDNGERKIAFIGISCKRYVTMHGISINCDCDLSWFDHIVSCGIEDKQITSVKKELLTKPRTISSGEDTSHDGCQACLDWSVESISQAFCRSFSRNFYCIVEDEENKLIYD